MAKENAPKLVEGDAPPKPNATPVADPTDNVKVIVPATPNKDEPHARVTMEHLESQDKVTMMLELRDGEPFDQDITINEVRYTIPRGEYVSIPRQVAQVLREKMAAEGKLKQVSDQMARKLAGLN